MHSIDLGVLGKPTLVGGGGNWLHIQYNYSSLDVTIIGPMAACLVNFMKINDRQYNVCTTP